MSLPRVVLDTNCVVSALIFSRNRFAWCRQAWQRQQFRPLASRDTVSELLRVLAYPKFRLNPSEQETLLAEFLPDVETVQIKAKPSGLPKIRDADDLIFFELAVVSQADALVSGDADLQVLREQFQIPILTLAEFEQWLQA